MHRLHHARGSIGALTHGDREHEGRRRFKAAVEHAETQEGDDRA